MSAPTQQEMADVLGKRCGEFLKAGADTQELMGVLIGGGLQIGIDIGATKDQIVEVVTRFLDEKRVK